MRRWIKMAIALWPFYILAAIIVSGVWALSQKPVIADYPPTPPAEVAKREALATHLEAIDAAKQFVTSQLKAPSTAKFSSVMESTVEKNKRGEFLVTGFVDAQNSYGAMLRTNWNATMIKTGNDWKLVKLQMQP